jgi:hypothetical protein
LQAQARLNSRRRSSKDDAAPAAKQNGSARRGQGCQPQRRLSDQDKQAGIRRLRERIRSIERQLCRAGPLRTHARAKLDEELVAARRLLARWDDTH